VAGLVILGAVVAYRFEALGGSGPKFDSRPPQATGVIIAQEALKLRQAGPVNIFARDTSAFKQPAADTQLASLKKALASPVDTLQLVPLDPLRPIRVPSADFMQMIRKTPQGGVIISLLGPPVLSDADRVKLGPIKASIIAFCPGGIPEQIDLRPLFEQGLLREAIVSKKNPDRTTSPGSPRGWFDRYFQVVTADNLSELPSPPVAAR
jgi:hypothetical protein